MLQSAKRRLGILERSIELPPTAERFMARVAEHVRLTGASNDDAIRALTTSISDENLDRLIDALLLQGFDGNIEAAKEWRRQAGLETGTEAANQPNYTK